MWNHLTEIEDNRSQEKTFFVEDSVGAQTYITY